MEVSHPSRQVVLFFLSLCCSGLLCEPFHYSVPEEKKAGSIVANVLKDLKVDVKDLSARRAQLISKSSRQDFQLDPQSGNIILRYKIDREALCGLSDPCTLFSEILLENPLQFFKIEIQVEDVNDNSPIFSQDQFLFEIPEQTPINARFPLETAHDLDKGKNAIQNYILSPNEYFKLDVQSQNNGRKYAELLLAKPLDREVIPQFILTLEAVDGGIPRRTGTAQIIIDILDINDNVPQFEQTVYEVQLMENSHPGSLVAKVKATDRDIGSNAHIIYTFSQAPADVLRSFRLSNQTGEIRLLGKIDYEENHNYELSIKATDGGGLSTYCKVLIDVEDENDNAPEIIVSSITNPLPENSPPETLVALFGIRDQDSGDNGRTTCNTEKNLPFILKLTENNYYQLVTQQPLDREQLSHYNITITATDQGFPRLTSMTIISIQLSDVNDNAPMFERGFYNLHLRENNIPGLLIGSVHAVDVDTEQNAKVTYSLLFGKIREEPASSYISINSETGNLYAIRSIDYEDMQDFQVMVRAVDKGSPPLSSETMVRVLITDENDNAPFILCPLQNSTSPSNDLVPRGAETGYLVTKVVAVDRDSGQNSWLSYQLLKATDPSLFAVGTQNGEVKTMRLVNIRDSFKHTLIVAVRDNGHPPQSASATLRILLVDGFSDPYMKIMDNPKGEVPQEGDHTLTLYLIICLVAISSIFLLSVTVFIATKFQKRRKIIGSSHSASNFPGGPNLQEKCVDPNTGTSSQAYSYEVCLAEGSLSSEFKFLRPFFPVFTMEHQKTLRNPQIHNDCHDLPNQLEERDHISQCKEIEENYRIEKTRDLFKKIGEMKGMFHAKMGMIKDKNGRDQTEAEEIKKRLQNFTEELYKNELNVPENHNGVALTLSQTS
ncbi:protocadherin beta-16-like [Erythrolamprus reginae]|uniref:protocadherin beta-16-like n=1 Tax=Erythrolamprus reginae TaxID=121349 RepID=UPI00396C3569